MQSRPPPPPPPEFHDPTNDPDGTIAAERWNSVLLEMEITFRRWSEDPDPNDYPQLQEALRLLATYFTNLWD